MPTSIDSREVLFYSAKEILNFSEGWKSLYQPYPWPDATSRDVQTCCNDYGTSTDVVEVINEPKTHVQRDSKYFINGQFTPNDHSTPNVKVNKKTTDASKNTSSYNNSIEAMSFSTTYPDTSDSMESTRHDSHSTIHSCPDRCAGDGGGGEDGCGVPSISGVVDRTYSHKFTSKEIYCDRNRNRRRLRKTGIKGVRCIVSFALTDDPIKKRTQIQACSISVMILAIVSISFVLVYFTSNKYSNVTKVAVPRILTNSSNETLETTARTVRLPEVESLITNEEIRTVRPDTTTEAFGDRAISEKNFAISQIISKIQKNIRSYPKRRERFNDTAIENDIVGGNATEECCSKCQKEVEVCMLNEESGIPVCIKSVDRHDPTGCGGLCAMETEACQLVDRARGVRVCRALSTLRCAPHEWRCHNGLCVARNRRCDGRVDCYDRSDETHCDCDLSKHFRCGHGTSCLPNTKLCDGAVDCWDGHDELNCTNACPENEFTCTNGQCIARGRFCDGLADCADATDEPHGCDACASSEVRCDNRRCVARATRCDGVDHCGDGTDERHCP